MGWLRFSSATGSSPRSRILETPIPGAAPPLPEPKRIEMDLGDGLPQNLQRRYTLDLSTIKPPLTEGTTIEYWMEARDANDVTGPGIGESEHHTIKVVSEVEKKAEVMRRLME